MLHSLLVHPSQQFDVACSFICKVQRLLKLPMTSRGQRQDSVKQFKNTRSGLFLDQNQNYSTCGPKPHTLTPLGMFAFWVGVASWFTIFGRLLYYEHIGHLLDPHNPLCVCFIRSGPAQLLFKHLDPSCAQRFARFMVGKILLLVNDSQ